ncbi:MAG: hypothetical protein OEM24_04310 [Paracoccaceae bacterium]|nr:hypothetical protein [Paracoccaceae bacterium]
MIRYARGPVSFLYRDVKSQKTGKIRRTKSKQILWGDWVRVTGPDARPGWSKVKYGLRSYLMKDADLQPERVLEIIFLDVGQGDGCILTEPGSHPDPRILVVDAGIGKNMNAFLKWRYKDFPETGNLHAAVITHPDQDHYKGFQNIFDNEAIQIAHVWHNGLIERTGNDLLGPASGGYQTDLRNTNDDAAALLSVAANRGRKNYPKLLHSALTSPRIGPVEALHTGAGMVEDGRVYVPGFAPSSPGPLSIEVLGPVVEPDALGRPRLRQFGATPTSTSPDDGKTKNGHSILLRLDFNGFRVLFGGDLNTPSESFLMGWYGDGGRVPPPLSGHSPLLARISRPEVIAAAAERFRVDLMKTCHHGSSDVTEEFLQASEPTAYVISSGDEESHVHPRPDLLGLLGKSGRGARPLLLSTELLRSTRERDDPDLARKLETIGNRIEAEVVKGAGADADKLKAMRSEQKTLRKRVNYRNVGVYGAVNLRTDGENAVIAFRKESGPETTRWFYYELQRDAATGQFHTVLKGH